MFNNEDVTIGSWMLAMNVHHEDNRAICDPRCTPTSIAVWDIPKCSGNGTFLKMLCFCFFSLTKHPKKFVFQSSSLIKIVNFVVSPFKKEL